MFSVTFGKIHDFRYYGRTGLIGDKKNSPLCSTIQSTTTVKRHIFTVKVVMSQSALIRLEVGLRALILPSSLPSLHLQMKARSPE